MIQSLGMTRDGSATSALTYLHLPEATFAHVLDSVLRAPVVGHPAEVDEPFRLLIAGHLFASAARLQSLYLSRSVGGIHGTDMLLLGTSSFMEFTRDETSKSLVNTKDW